MLEGEYGVRGAALSVPVMLGRGGVHDVREWPLSDEQLGALRAAGEAVRAATASL